MVALNPPIQFLQGWNKKILERFKKAKSSDSPKKSELETAVVFDFTGETVFRVELPRDELLSTIDHGSRYVASADYSKPLGVGLTSVFGAMFGFLMGYFVGGLGLSLLLFIVFAVSGAAAGFYFISPMIARRPLWVLAKVEGVIAGIPHSTTFRNENGPSGLLTPGFIYEIMEARDYSTFFRHGLSRWQKLAVGALVTLAIACLVALFLFVGAFGTGG